jgi:hypothetical protein
MSQVSWKEAARVQQDSGASRVISYLSARDATVVLTLQLSCD